MIRFLSIVVSLHRHIAADISQAVVLVGLLFALPLVTHTHWIPPQYGAHYELTWCVAVARTLVPRPFPALALALGLGAIVAGRRIGGYKSTSGAAVVLLVAAMPSLAATPEILDRAADLKTALLGDLSPTGIAGALRSGLLDQLGLVTGGGSWAPGYLGTRRITPS